MIITVIKQKYACVERALKNSTASVLENADQNNTNSMIKYLMKCRKIGDKVGENSRNPRYKICMYQANASDTNNTQ